MLTSGGITVIGGFNLIPASGGGGGGGGGGGPSPTTSSFIGLANFSYTNKSYTSAGTCFNSVFSEDGTKLYYNNAGNVTQFALGTAFDISTATSTGKTGPAMQTAYGFDFSTDGTKMYGLARGTASIRQYTLATAWDVSTATYTKQIAAGTGTYQDMAVASDGSAIFYSASGVIKKLVMSTPWDVATGTIDATTFNAGGGYAIGVAVTRDGMKLLTAMYPGHSIREYTLSAAFNLSSPTLVTTYNPAVDARPGGDTYGISLGKQDTRLLNAGSGGSTSYLFSDGT